MRITTIKSFFVRFFLTALPFLLLRFRPMRASNQGAYQWPLAFEELEVRVVPVATNLGPAPQYVTPPAPSSPLEPQHYSGRVNTISIIPTTGNQKQVLVGTASGGVWGSNSYVDSLSNPSWTPESDNWALPGSQPIDPVTGLGAGAMNIGTVAVDPTNPSIIYAGTGDIVLPGATEIAYGTGVFKSKDRGQTWTLLSTGTRPGRTEFFRHVITKVFVDPRPGHQNWLYLGLGEGQGIAPRDLGDPRDDGIYQSTDGGNTWIKITGGIAGGIGDRADVTDLDYTYTVDRSHKLTVFAGIRAHRGNLDAAGRTIGGVYRSSFADGMQGPWEQITDNVMAAGAAAALAPADVERVTFAATHQINQRTVVAAIADSNGFLYGVFQTVSDGQRWSDLRIPAFLVAKDDSAWYTLAVGLSPNGRVYYGGGGSAPLVDKYVPGALGIGLGSVRFMWTFMPSPSIATGMTFMLARMAESTVTHWLPAELQCPTG
jgi:hypothetical protein